MVSDFKTMYIRSSLLLGFSGLFSIAWAQKDNGDECSCFRTNGSTPAYFTNHIFQDYRSINDIPNIPSIITSQTGAANALVSSDFFDSDAWSSVWQIQSWNNSDSFAANSASVFMINSPSNVYIESSTDDAPDYSTYLTLRTSRIADFQTAAEIDTVAQNFHYVSMRFLARVIGSPGACAGMFTYFPDDDPDKVQEADIEILTRDPRNAVQYTNQPSDSQDGDPNPKATVNATNPGERDWTLWNTYRLDWTPEMSSWYVNGESVANISYQAPRDPQGLIVNMWSDGSVWTGNMSLHDEAYLQIQWIQVAYNTSGPVTGSTNTKRDAVGHGGLLQKRKGDPGCEVVCSIDEEVNTTGTPALLYNNTGTAAGGWRGDGMGAMVWLPLVLIGSVVFGLL